MPAFNVPANLAFDSYQKLGEAIADWMDRNDLSGSVGAMIALAEGTINRELSPFFGEEEVSLSVVDGAATLPVDYGMPVRVMYGGRSLYQRGRWVSSGDMLPSMKLERGRLVVSPAADYTVSLLYTPKLVPLSEEAPTNDLLDQHPDLYFFGAMLFGEGYVANDQRAAMFKGLFEEALESAKRWYLARRYAGPLVPRLAS